MPSAPAGTRCALWERVSDAHQDTAAQHGALVQEAERRGLTVVRVFDVTASGYHGQQEHQFSKLVDGLSRREYGVVICWAIDRLTRQGVSETLQAVSRITKAGGHPPQPSGAVDRDQRRTARSPRRNRGLGGQLRVSAQVREDQGRARATKGCWSGSGPQAGGQGQEAQKGERLLPPTRTLK